MDKLFKKIELPSIEDIKKEVLEFCMIAQKKEEILKLIGVDLTPYTFKKYITGLIKNRYITHTISKNLKDPNQQYILTLKGKMYLKSVA